MFVCVCVCVCLCVLSVCVSVCVCVCSPTKPKDSLFILGTFATMCMSVCAFAIECV